MAMRSRSDACKALQKPKKLDNNVLPLNSEVISHYFFLRNSFSDSNPGFFHKIPAFGDIKEKLFKDEVALWRKSGLPIVSKQRVEAKLKELIDRYTAARKKALKRGDEKIDEVWLKNLFDLCRCKCSIPDVPTTHRKKFACSCACDNQIPEKELNIIEDQRSVRKMIISTVDVSFRREEMRKASHRPNRPATVFVDLPDSVAVPNSKNKSSDTFFTSTKLRKRSARFMAQDETEDDINPDSDEEYPTNKNTWWKKLQEIQDLFSY